MRMRSVHDRAELAALLSRDPVRHAYELGDLDDFFWPHTTWYALEDAVALLYHGAGTATLLLFGDPAGAAGELIDQLEPVLPARFHAHLSIGLEKALETGDRRITSVEPHLRMALTGEPRPAAPAADVPVVALGPADLAELAALYAAAYPENWFDARMLETGQYVGIRRGGELLAVAGVHVWSPAYRVAALGNVTTRPDVRGQGLAGTAVTALVRRLRPAVDHIALNVRADNAAAIALYRRLGFTEASRFVELDAAPARTD
ncbi:GNAT family N-acetyltransferase [Plantactinospora siamensis]|uniref:GNAT family N-acetyltransferase n=1 Tax=Plantactinospora siamensis TaxID=555372 RepID=A0ABV6P6I5_9ACTN